MTKKLQDIKGDLYSKAEDVYFKEGMDVQKSIMAMSKVIEIDLEIAGDYANQLSQAIINKVIKKFNY